MAAPDRFRHSACPVTGEFRARRDSAGSPPKVSGLCKQPLLIRYLTVTRPTQGVTRLLPENPIRPPSAHCP